MASDCSYLKANMKGYHLRLSDLPACCFPDSAERTYDCSFRHFAGLVTEGAI